MKMCLWIHFPKKFDPIDILSTPSMHMFLTNFKGIDDGLYSTNLTLVIVVGKTGLRISKKLQGLQHDKQLNLYIIT